MATKDYTKVRRGASKSLGRSGQTVTWRRAGVTAEDEGAGTVTVGSPTDYSITGVVTLYRDQDIDNTLIQRGDKKLLLDAQDFADAGVTPTDADEVVISGTLHSVVDLQPVSPAGVSVLYKAQVRAAG